MFQTISWMSLSLVLAGIGLHWLISPLRLAKREDEWRSCWKCCGETDSALAKLNRLACVVALASLTVLFATGFGGVQDQSFGVLICRIPGAWCDG